MSTLSPLQFGEQLEFPGMPPKPTAHDTGRPVDPPPAPTDKPGNRPDYDRERRAGGAPNRLPKTPENARMEADRAVFNELVPTYNITSAQKTVSRPAVEHMINNANFLALDETPELQPYKVLGHKEAPPAHPSPPMRGLSPTAQDPTKVRPISDDRFDVADGNHRANAAIGVGQMFMEARVWRDRRKTPLY